MKVVGADDAGGRVCKDCFRDVVLDAQGRQTGANDTAQIVVDPTGERDGVMILTARAPTRDDASGTGPSIWDTTTISRRL